MSRDLRELPRAVRQQSATTIRTLKQGLVDDMAGILAREPGPGHQDWRGYGDILLDLLVLAIEDGSLNAQQPGVVALRRDHALSVRQLVRGVDVLERVTVDELALDARIGRTTEPWPMVTHALRHGMLEIVAAFCERDENHENPHDALTTLISRPAFDLALGQEIRRARRHRHGFAMILFDIDDLASVNAAQGLGAGDRLIQRLGILARSFFRTHDWVARHGGDSLAALLPEATLDQASTLASIFCQTVQQRLVLVDHKTDQITTVTVSAAAIGTNAVQSEIEPDDVMEEAEAALLRAKMNGGNRVERVYLFPTSVTIVGAATLLDLGVREVVNLIRRGTLAATRRGRHLHIDRDAIETHKRLRDA